MHGHRLAGVVFLSLSIEEAVGEREEEEEKGYRVSVLQNYDPPQDPERSWRWQRFGIDHVIYISATTPAVRINII